MRCHTFMLLNSGDWLILIHPQNLHFVKKWISGNWGPLPYINTSNCSALLRCAYMGYGRSDAPMWLGCQLRQRKWVLETLLEKIGRHPIVWFVIDPASWHGLKVYYMSDKRAGCRPNLKQNPLKLSRLNLLRIMLHSTSVALIYEGLYSCWYRIY